jgi:eukaryotic-like serine/threonine-protein kinase
VIAGFDDPGIQGHTPQPFSEGVAAGTFMLFPLTIKNIAVDLIYAHEARAGQWSISENIVSMLRTMQNQALLATQVVKAWLSLSEVFTALDERAPEPITSFS